MKYSSLIYIAAAVLLIFFIGLLDYVTGPDVSFSIFYIYPILFISWHIGKQWGMGLAFLSMAVWLSAELAGGKPYSHFLIPYWNALVRGIFFVVVGVSVPLFKKELQKSTHMVVKLSTLLPMCAWCKQIRDEHGSWHRLEEYLESSSGSEVTHGICPTCIEKHHSTGLTNDDRESDTRSRVARAARIPG